MILGLSHSINGVPIRLTDERWEHILDSHPELASFRETLLDAVENPDYILAVDVELLPPWLFWDERLFFTYSTLRKAATTDSSFPLA